MDDHSHVRRFMLLATARTGSNLLLSLLSAHPAIKTHGELFNLGKLPRGSLIEALDDPVAYLRGRVYKDQRPEIAAVGFKMFYDHLTQHYFDKMIDVADASAGLQERFRELEAFIDAHYAWDVLHQRFRSTWEFLVADRSLAVIHLRRRNSLDTLISLKAAFSTRQWWTLDGGDRPRTSDRPRTTVHLEPDECRRYFQMVEAFADEAAAAFTGHPTLDVTYDDLVEHRDDELRRIFTFLNVPDRLVSTRMQKQNLVAASECVDNYGELKRCFEHSRWSVFFE
jgi:LPS sulfotransferase NodH